jgi:stage V sporulation protein G
LVSEEITMEITEVRVKLVQDNTERLRAFCSVTFDGEYVVRDLKIIEGTNGLFVAMPSRKLTDRCPKCRSKNHLRAKFCNECGAKLNENRAGRDSAGRTKLHADVAHPINARCRERIQNAIVEAYEQETERAKEPGYRPPRLEEDDYEGSDYEELVAELKRDRGAARQASKPSAAPPPPEQTEEQPTPAEGEEPSEPAKGDDEFSAGIF